MRNVLQEHELWSRGQGLNIYTYWLVKLTAPSHRPQLSDCWNAGTACLLWRLRKYKTRSCLAQHPLHPQLEIAVEVYFIKTSSFSLRKGRAFTTY